MKYCQESTFNIQISIEPLVSSDDEGGRQTVALVTQYKLIGYQGYPDRRRMGDITMEIYMNEIINKPELEQTKKGIPDKWSFIFLNRTISHLQRGNLRDLSSAPIP